jgi:hypothetical protein
MAQVAADILDKFKDRPNFRGLNWTAYLTGEWLPNFPDPDDASPFTHSYDDTTIRLFEKETGHVVPVDPKDPQRFQKRFVSLTAEPLRTPWTEWRGRKVRDFFAQVRDLVRQARPGLDLFVSPYINVSHARQWSLAQAASSGPSEAASIQSYLRNRGYDPAIFQPLDGLWLTRWTHATVKYAPLSHEPAYAAGWRQNLDDEFIRLYDHPERRAVMIMHHWDENSYAAPGAKPVTLRTSETWELTLPDGTEWPVAGNRGRLHAQPCGDFAREAFMQALVTSDPLQLLFGFVDVNLLVGNEQSLRDFARVFRSLPVSPSRPALGTSLKTDLAIREWPRPDGLFFAVANPCPWPIEGRVAVSGVERILALPSEKAAMTAPEGDSQAVTMRLVPFGVRAFRAEGPQAARLVSWRAAPVDGKSLDHLRRLIDGGKKTLNTPESASSLSAADTAFLREATSQAESALHEGKHALAWQTVTGWRYWTLLKKPAGRGM